VGFAESAGSSRAYQGEINGATVRQHAAYWSPKNYGFTASATIFSAPQGRKTHPYAVESFRAAAPGR